MALNIGKNDEVIVPNRTWIATAHAPFLLGAKVKIVDVEENRPIMNCKLIEKEITSKTKAIIPVHMCGRSVDMNLLNIISKKYNIPIIEDAAQALGSKNENGYLGTQSDLGCFSFSVAKIIATGQGGFIVTKNKILYDKLIAIRTHGVGDIVNAKFTQPGFNFRFTDILASIGIVQLSLLEKRIARVIEIYKFYELNLKKLNLIKIIQVNIINGEVPVYIEVLCEHRDDLVNYLKKNKIQSRPFYPNISDAKYLESNNKFSNSQEYSDNGLYLPSGPEQKDEDLKFVIETLFNFEKSFGNDK
jgi:dTDP-4-amino-4,6-dideoxygalactose transaminase